MASITREPNGRKTVQFVGSDGKRRSIRLGKVSQRDAEQVKMRVEHLLAAQVAGLAPDTETARWVAALDGTIAERIVKVGLISADRLEKSNSTTGTLEGFLNDYIAKRNDLKPSTIRHLNEAARKLVTFFGADKPLGNISPGDADEFRRDLEQQLGPNTVRRMCGRAKQFFRTAVRKRQIPENPFADMKDCSVRGNKEREFFVSRKATEKLLEAAPDAQWRLLLALSRYGGLRCPSEH